MAKVEFSEYEQEVIHFLAKHFSEKDQHVEFSEFPHFEELGRNKILEVAERLARFGLLEDHTNRSMTILPGVIDVAEKLNNPPVRDRWEETTKWFRSKWWSLPVLGLLVGLPALKGWVDIVKSIAEWMGWIHSGK